MFKLEEICEEFSQIQIPMRPEELEAIGVHVEEEAPMTWSVFRMAT